MNILDYIDWRGDITFEQSGFNEVDNIIFSTLVYLNMDKLVSEDDSLFLTIEELYRKYKSAGYDQSFMINDPLPLLDKAAQSPRFKDVIVKWYVNKIDVEQQLQFAAVTFIISDHLSYIAFRGTDNTIVGWREDCNLSFLPETPGQKESVMYVNRIAKRTSGDLIVGGHSKGGNFAVYAAAFCDKAVSESRIIKVFSNDGPGFNNDVVASAEYFSILNKMIKIIPESSLIGILLLSKAKHKVIKSDSKGIMQHNPYSWCVKGAAFESADEQAGSSLLVDEALTRWGTALSDENKQVLVNAVFDSLEASGAKTLNEISQSKWASFSAIIRAAAKIDSKNMNNIVDSLKKLFVSSKDAVISETQRNTGMKKSDNNML